MYFVLCLAKLRKEIDKSSIFFVILRKHPADGRWIKKMIDNGDTVDIPDIQSLAKEYKKGIIK